MPNFDPETGKLTPEGREALGTIQTNHGKTAPVTTYDKATGTETVTRQGEHTTGQTIRDKNGVTSGVETITKPKTILVSKDG